VATHGDTDASASDEKVALQFYRDPALVGDVTMTDIEGRRISTADLKGKVVIVNFWATWCPPCRAEIPDLVALQAKYGGQLQVIGVSQDEGPLDGVKRFAQTSVQPAQTLIRSDAANSAGFTGAGTVFGLSRG